MRVLPAALTLLALLVGCSDSSDQESNKPATQILDDAANALRSIQSYRVDGMLDPGFTVHLVIVRNGAMGTVMAKGITWRMVARADTLWLRGRALWAKTLPRVKATQLGDDWVQVNDPKAAFNYARSLHNLHVTIPTVVFHRRTLENKGERVVNGQRVIRLENDDDIYDVRATGTPYPLTWLEKENPGPDGQPCGIRLSAFDAPAALDVPLTTQTLP
jgi:hypothetical protein